MRLGIVMNSNCGVRGAECGVDGWRRGSATRNESAQVWSRSRVHVQWMAR
jgi:hypothetical protein